MGKGTFRALVVAFVLVVIVLVAVTLLHPRSRGAIVSFFAPLPESARDGGAVVLPPLGGVRGAESAELRTLREDASASAANPSPIRRRAALFGLGADGDIPSSGERFVRPSGLRRADIALRDEARIDRALQHLTSDARARERFVDAWKRSGRFSTDIARILRAWKVSDALVAVALVESSFQPGMADADAVGAWQLPPDVAHVYGLSMLPAYDERRGIASSTEAAARYLADLRERFGSWELALAAYAIGYKPTLDLLTKQESGDFWELAATLPRDAVVYVAEVMGTATLLANLDRFGLDSVKRADALTVSDLEVPAGTSLPLAAKAAGIPLSTLHELNPEYATDIVPTTSFRMVLHVPSETLARARERLTTMQEGSDLPSGDGGVAEPELDAAAAVRPVVSRGSDNRIFYRVREGDTLPSLAREHRLSVDTIASDNALDPTSSLHPGMILALRVVAEPDAATATAPLVHPPPPRGGRKPRR